MKNITDQQIHNAVITMLKAGKYDVYLHEIFGNDVFVHDICVVTCFYGTDAARLKSTIQALSLFERYKAKPAEVIVIEAQYSKNEIQLESFAKIHNFKYIFVELSEKQRHIFIKQALFNIGTKTSTAEKIVYLDSDVGFCNPYWLANVSLLLDECDIAQPFGYAYYVYQNDMVPVRTQLEMSALKRVIEKNDNMLSKIVGFAFAMKRSVFNLLGGFDVQTCPNDDLQFWHKFLNISPARLQNLPY